MSSRNALNTLWAGEMLFNSFEFIFVFLPLVLGGHVLLSRLPYAGAPILWLLGASLFFYSWWNRFEGPWVGEADLAAVTWFAFWIAVLWFWPNTQQIMRRFEPALPLANPTQIGRALHAWQPSLRWAAVVSITGVLAVLNLNHVSEFLYFQF